MGGSGGGSSGRQTYAHYIEDYHKTFLALSEEKGNVVRDYSPYLDYAPDTPSGWELRTEDHTAALYGAAYDINNFPSLYDIYGKFMASLDVEALFEQVLNEVQNADVIQDMSTAHKALLSDDIEQEVLPRYKAGMRDINSVISTTFNIGRAIIENARVKKVAEFDAGLQFKLIPLAAEVFSKHLAWNTSVVDTYKHITHLGIVTEMDDGAINSENKIQNALWPFTVMECERANLAALQSAMSNTQGAGASKVTKAIGGALSGAAAGTMVAPGLGTAIGGALGGLSGLL